MTELFITVNGIGFKIFQDMTRTHNLISPAFLSFFREEYPSSEDDYQANQRTVETIIRNSKDAFPILPPHLNFFFFKDVFKVIGHGVTRGSDKKLRWCRTIQFNFEYNSQTYKELFYIDKNLCATGVLGKYSE